MLPPNPASAQQLDGLSFTLRPIRRQRFESITSAGRAYIAAVTVFVTKR